MAHRRAPPLQLGPGGGRGHPRRGDAALCHRLEQVADVGRRHPAIVGSPPKGSASSRRSHLLGFGGRERERERDALFDEEHLIHAAVCQIPSVAGFRLHPGTKFPVGLRWLLHCTVAGRSDAVGGAASWEEVEYSLLEHMGVSARPRMYMCMYASTRPPSEVVVAPERRASLSGARAVRASGLGSERQRDRLSASVW